MLQKSDDTKQVMVYNQIKEAIIRKDFPPGTILVERKLCDLFKMSRSPIRNALRQLTTEGLLSFEPGKGTIVPLFTVEDILEVYDLIEILQLYAVRTFVGHLDDVALLSLKEIIDSMRSSIDAGESFINSQWDAKFHDFIIRHSYNKRLSELFKQLDNQRALFVVNTFDDIARQENSYLQHLEIYNSIAGKNLEACEKAIKSHYADIRQYYINRLLKKN